MTRHLARRRALARGLLAAACLVGAVTAHAAVTLKNAWMRPAPAGAETARAYVDIESDATLELVGARTPAAKRVEIVRVGTVGDPATENVVKTFAVLGGTTTRLAYRGDHLRLLQMTRDVANGDAVPLTLVFRDGGGKRVEAVTAITVRGLLLPQQVTPAARDGPAAPMGGGNPPTARGGGR